MNEKHKKYLDEITTLLNNVDKGAIVICIYETKADRDAKVDAINAQTRRPVHCVRITEEHPHPIHLLKELKAKPADVVHLFDIYFGFPHSFDYLEYQREAIDDMSISLICWVNRTEYQTLLKKSPNFFDFRTSTYDFRNVPIVENDNTAQPTNQPTISSYYNLFSGQMVANGKYRIEKLLMYEGFETVYLATDMDINRRVALRIINSDESMSKELLQTIVVPMYELLGVSGIPNFLNSGCIASNGLFFYAFQHIPGTTLWERLIHEDRLSSTEAMEILLKLCDTLREVHKRGWLHLDIKPSSVLLNEENKPFLINFWSAYHYSSELRCMGGTPAYGSPEQFVEPSLVSPASDIFALCATFYQTLTGSMIRSSETEILFRPAFVPPPHELIPSIPLHFSNAIMKGLEYRQEDRPQSIDEFVGLLKAGDVGVV